MKDRYHHGSLRQTLVKAALATIREDGVEKLSLRALARRAGVSTGAPYRHFADREALIAAVLTEGFTLFNTTLHAAHQQHHDDLAAGVPRAAIDEVVSLGVAYVRFAADEPELFRLMFGRTQPSLDTSPELATARRRAASFLPSALKRAQGEGTGAHIPLAELVELAWAAVHGLAMLQLDGMLPTKAPADAEARATRVAGRLGRLLSEAAG